MTRMLKIHWAFWTTLVVVVATGVLADVLSSAKLVTIELRPKAAIDVSVFRPLPDALRLSLSFNRTEGQKRPELGDYATTENSGFLEFKNPGAAIKLLVRGEDREVIYEALPASAYGTTIGRDLIPFMDDGNPNRFQWPPNLAVRPILPSGYSTFNISVLEVGHQLVDEQVTLIIGSPITFESTAPGYGFLWWFIFWPLYVLLLVVYGAALLGRSVHHYSPNIAVERDASPKSGSRPSP